MRVSELLARLETMNPAQKAEAIRRIVTLLARAG